MQEFVARLNELLAEYRLNYHDATVESLLEILYLVYIENSGVDNDEIRQNFGNLYTALTGRTIQEIDDIIDIVCELCRDHEKSGFVEGVKVGIRLSQEVELR